MPLGQIQKRISVAARDADVHDVSVAQHGITHLDSCLAGRPQRPVHVRQVVDRHALDGEHRIARPEAGTVTLTVVGDAGDLQPVFGRVDVNADPRLRLTRRPPRADHVIVDLQQLVYRDEHIARPRAAAGTERLLQIEQTDPDQRAVAVDQPRAALVGMRRHRVERFVEHLLPRPRKGLSGRKLGDDCLVEPARAGNHDVVPGGKLASAADRQRREVERSEC